MVTIALDSSTEVCSAALVSEGKVIAERLNIAGSNHAALLPTFVQQLQQEAKECGLTVDGIVLSEGPGSYTGLRIGASLAKGLCYGAELPLLAVPTLAVIAAGAISRQLSAISDQPSALICPMIDARRMEVYCALYDAELHELKPLQAVVVDAESFADMLEKHTIYFCGNGAEKCKAVISHPNARWMDGIVPTAAQAGLLAAKYGERTDLVHRIEGKEIAYFEPNYLKEFIAAPSHVKGLK
jgi:tRNA threonylcarbamoyladenosine biosynthesis protein TsaB